MLRVALLDTSMDGQPASMGRYCAQLATCLADHAADQVSTSTIVLGCSRQQWERTPTRLRMWRHHAHVWRAAKLLDASQFDVIHLLDGSFGYVVDAVKSNNVAVTVHDIIPRLQLDGRFPSAPAIGRGAQWVIKKALHGVSNSRMIVADSRSTADDLNSYNVNPELGVQVVPLALEPDLFASADERQDTAMTHGRPYLFHLGNSGFYKNRIGTIEVIKRLFDQEVDLVIAGPPSGEDVRRNVEKYGLSDRVHFRVYPDQQELIQLYRGAVAFLFPSLYEGFGWPPLEAMSVGCPVVSSGAGSLTEVIGDAGIVVDPNDYDAMAKGCQRLLSDKPFRDQMISAGRKRVEHFSIQRLADAMVQCYKQVANHQ